MKTNYCPHCQTVQGPKSNGGNYNISLCHDCTGALGLLTPKSAPRDQPDAAREDIDAPLEHATDVVAGTGKANSLDQITPDPKPAADSAVQRPTVPPDQPVYPQTGRRFDDPE